MACGDTYIKLISLTLASLEPKKKNRVSDASFARHVWRSAQIASGISVFTAADPFLSYTSRGAGVKIRPVVQIGDNVVYSCPLELKQIAGAADSPNLTQK